jgi:hypothetical protein
MLRFAVSLVCDHALTSPVSFQDLLDLAMFKRGEIRRPNIGLEVSDVCSAPEMRRARCAIMHFAQDVERARALMTGSKAISSGLRYLQYTSIRSPPWNVYGSPVRNHPTRANTAKSLHNIHPCLPPSGNSILQRRRIPVLGAHSF